MTQELLAAIPSPPQGVWHLGPIPIRAYALCIMTGVIVAILWSRKRYAARGGDPEVVMDAAVYVIIFGLIGGRAYHVLTQWDSYFCSDCQPLRVFNLTEGGLGILGAISLATVAVWLRFRRLGLSFATFADAVAPTIAVAQAIGRLGNWFNQELYGRETTLPWGLEIYRRVDDTGHYAPLSGHSTGEVLTVVHPTFLYEGLCSLAVAAILVWADRRFSLTGGRLFALYAVGYSVSRLWVESMRSDPANHIMGLRVNTVMYATVLLCALAFFLLRGSAMRARVLQEANQRTSDDARG